ncbi:MAG: hypothetical protein HUJ74_00040 [Lachnospiraceae bacterium]|nr:hypothetical protein [Lachnospiraceae bacterium]
MRLGEQIEEQIRGILTFRKTKQFLYIRSECLLMRGQKKWRFALEKEALI